MIGKSQILSRPNSLAEGLAAGRIIGNVSPPRANVFTCGACHDAEATPST